LGRGGQVVVGVGGPQAALKSLPSWTKSPSAIRVRSPVPCVPDGPHQHNDVGRCTPPVVLIHSPSISTATKYRNTTTAICHPARLCDTLPCSATNKVAAARSSGRRGVDHIRAGGRFKDQSTVDRDSYARHLAFDAMAARSAAGGA